MDRLPRLPGHLVGLSPSEVVRHPALRRQCPYPECAQTTDEQIRRSAYARVIHRADTPETSVRRIEAMVSLEMDARMDGHLAVPQWEWDLMEERLRRTNASSEVDPATALMRKGLQRIGRKFARNTHVGGNAEECLACMRSPEGIPYPFICPEPVRCVCGEVLSSLAQDDDRWAHASSETGCADPKNRAHHGHGSDCETQQGGHCSNPGVRCYECGETTPYLEQVTHHLNRHQGK